MAWEWVAPVAAGAAGSFGALLTYWTAKQGRHQVDRMAAETRTLESATALRREQRDAYFGALRVAELELRRRRYERTGEVQKLAKLETRWDKATRVEMTDQAEVALEVFGSPAAVELLRDWRSAIDDGHMDEAALIIERFRKLARAELATAPR